MGTWALNTTQVLGKVPSRGHAPPSAIVDVSETVMVQQWRGTSGCGAVPSPASGLKVREGVGRATCVCISAAELWVVLGAPTPDLAPMPAPPQWPWVSPQAQAALFCRKGGVGVDRWHHPWPVSSFTGRPPVTPRPQVPLPAPTCLQLRFVPSSSYRALQALECPPTGLAPRSFPPCSLAGLSSLGNMVPPFPRATFVGGGRA